MKAYSFFPAAGFFLVLTLGSCVIVKREGCISSKKEKALRNEMENLKKGLSEFDETRERVEALAKRVEILEKKLKALEGKLDKDLKLRGEIKRLEARLSGKADTDESNSEAIKRELERIKRMEDQVRMLERVLREMEKSSKVRKIL